MSGTDFFNRLLGYFNMNFLVVGQDFRCGYKGSTNIQSIKDEDYISLTDIARIKNEDDTNLVISNWLRKVDTIEFLNSDVSLLK